MGILMSRDDWRKKKETWGIPDAVCKWSMGERLAAFEKAEKAIGPANLDGLVDELGKIIPDLKAYQVALGKMKPEKFKGKTAPEQAKSFAGAKEELKDLVKKAEDVRGFYKMQVGPMVHLQQHYADVVKKFKALPRDSHQGLQDFYDQEIRNTLGLAVGKANKLDIGAAVKQDLAAYIKFANNADGMIQGNNTDWAKVRVELAKALAVLAEHMK